MAFAATVFRSTFECDSGPGSFISLHVVYSAIHYPFF